MLIKFEPVYSNNEWISVIFEQKDNDNDNILIVNEGPQQTLGRANSLQASEPIAMQDG